MGAAHIYILLACVVVCMCVPKHAMLVMAVSLRAAHYNGVMPH